MRRLGSRRRRANWDYSELFAVTLVLIWWSAMVRMLFTLHAIWFPWDLDMGWLHTEEGQLPILKALAWMLVGLLIMNAGCFFEPRNRTRAAVALTALNLAFIGLLGSAVFLHARFGADLVAHRLSGARSEGNLTRELAGRWEVFAREEPPGAPQFPANAVTFVTWNGSPSLEGRTPALLDAWWSLEPTEAIRPSTPLFADLEQLLFGERRRTVFEWAYATRFERACYTPPAVLFHTLVRRRTGDLPSSPYQLWAAEMHQVEADVLSFETVETEPNGAPIARVWLRRPVMPAAGRDFAIELARETISP